VAERPAFAELRYDVADRVATLTLARPAALNALTIKLKEELLSALRAAERDRDVRAVVLTGEGRAFCAGQDLRERLEPEAVPLGEEIRLRYNPLVRALRGLSKPTLASVNGVAAGAGVSLALACDVRVASEVASFVLAFGRIGLVPDSGASWVLPRLVGSSKAMELALLDDPLSATDAERFGLVARVVPADRLAHEAAGIAGRLAALAPTAVALTKRSLARAWDVGFDEQLEFEAYAQAIAGATADHAEGIAAFTEKREPRFTGD
jgi:2-(1,2-epoxy-1,2-dihydrophenyl)acetyl-CoA isomerase